MAKIKYPINKNNPSLCNKPIHKNIVPIDPGIFANGIGRKIINDKIKRDNPEIKRVSNLESKGKRFATVIF